MALIFLAASVAAASTGAGDAYPPTPAMRLLWEENFDGPELNASRWNILEQIHRGGVYTKENVLLREGVLVLRTIAQNMTIEQGGKEEQFYVSSGAVNTSGLDERFRGRWEVVAKLPLVGLSLGYTLHSSIWLFSNTRDPQRSGCSQEIDVIEQYMTEWSAGNADPYSRVAANLHPFSGNRSTGCVKLPNREGTGEDHDDFSTGWTTFTVDWTDSWISMRANGTVYGFYNDTSAIEAFTDPLFLALTACVMNRVPVNGSDAFPREYQVDRVAVYEWE